METRIKTDLASEPVTTTQVKQFIKFAYDTDADEVSLLEQLISAVRTHLEMRTGLVFAPKTYVVLFDSLDAEDLHHDLSTLNPQVTGFTIPVAPVDSITKVETVQNGTNTEVDYTEEGNYRRTIIYPLANEELRVTLQAGFGGNTENLPEDIKQAIIRQVGRWYWNREDFAEGTFLDEVTKIINRYEVV